MMYLIYTALMSVELAQYEIVHAKFAISGTSCII